MATFNSATNGNWNDGATWGNTSPGSKGTDWPGNAGDVVNIAHTVVYNVSETNELGAVTINSGGILTFSASTNTFLTLGHVNLTVANGGELRVGATGTPIDDAYTAAILWNTTSDNAKGLSIAAGGKVEIHGDPEYYGSDGESTLQANWTTGQTFTVVGNYSTKWRSGQTLLVHKGTTYAAYGTDVALVTLNGAPSNASNSVCTINESFPTGTFYAGGKVVNVSRNVTIAKYNATTAIGNYNTNRPFINDANTSSGNYNASNSIYTGLYCICSGSATASKGGQFLACTARNCNYVINSGYGHTISGNLFSNNYVANYGVNHTFSGNVLANSYAIFYGNCHTISGSIFSNNYGVYSGTGHAVSGNVYANANGIMAGTKFLISGNVYLNATGISYGNGHIVTGRLSYTASDVLAANTADFKYNQGGLDGLNAVLRGAKTQNPPTFSQRNTAGIAYGKQGVYSEDDNQVVGAMQAWLPLCTILKVTDVVRSGGASSSLKVTPQTNLGTHSPQLIAEWTEFDVPASSQTRRVYVLGSGWSSWPTASELWLEAEYYSAASGVAKTVIASTDVLTDNTTWTALSVTFTPGQVALVRYRIYFAKYAASSWINVDNMLVNS